MPGALGIVGGVLAFAAPATMVIQAILKEDAD